VEDRFAQSRRALRSNRPRRRVGQHAREVEGRECARVTSGCGQGEREATAARARHLRRPPARRRGRQAARATAARGRRHGLPARDPRRGAPFGGDGRAVTSARQRSESERGGVLIVLAGTSGAGKGTLGRRLRDHDPGLEWSVSWTSRAPRPGETPGIDYHFKTREEFEALRDAGGFLEWFEVYGDLKGTPRAFVTD